MIRGVQGHSIGLSALMAVTLVVLAGCQPDPLSSDQRKVSPNEITQYVAMGDSFVSGPAIAPSQSGSGNCLRSGRNYPHLLANELDIDGVIDVSCAGASSAHLTKDVPVLGKVHDSLPAQEDALTSETSLVTVGVGYNDEAILLLASCLSTGAVNASTEPQVADCQDFAKNSIPGMLEDVENDVTSALKEIRRAAPHATVVLVGYLPLLPEPDACPNDLFKVANQRSTYDVEVAVDDSLRKVAAKVDIEFVSMRKAGRGHGMCSETGAWVNGLAVEDGDGVVVHPRAAGMQAVADEVAARLRTFERSG